MSASVYDPEGADVYARHRGTQSGVLCALLALQPIYAGGRVLEVGCGTASHLRAVRDETGCGCWGTDLSAGMLERALDGGEGLHRCLATAEALPFPDASFELLFSVDVIHHIPDLDAAFGEVARLLRPGGVVLTATDSEATIRARTVLSDYFPETVPHELARYPSVAHLERLHARHGLEIIDAQVAEQVYVLSDASAFRARAYSCLHLISQEALHAGVARLERALPLTTVSRNYVIVARKMGSKERNATQCQRYEGTTGDRRQ